MKKIKKFLTLVFAFVTVVSLSACNEIGTTDTTTSSGEETTTDATAETTTDTTTTTTTTVNSSDVDQLRIDLMAFLDVATDLTSPQQTLIVNNVMIMILDNGIVHADALELIDDLDDLYTLIDSIGTEDFTTEETIDIVEQLTVIVDNGMSDSSISGLLIDLLGFLVDEIIDEEEEENETIIKIDELINEIGSSAEGTLSTLIRIMRSSLSSQLMAVIDAVETVAENETLTESEVELAISEVLEYYEDIIPTSSELDDVFDLIEELAAILAEDEDISTEDLSLADIADISDSIRGIVENQIDVVQYFLEEIDYDVISAIIDLNNDDDSISAESIIDIARFVGALISDNLALITDTEAEILDLYGDAFYLVTADTFDTDVDGATFTALIESGLLETSTAMIIEMYAAFLLSDDLNVTFINTLIADLETIEDDKETAIALLNIQYYEDETITESQYWDGVEEAEDLAERLSMLTIMNAAQSLVQEMIATLSDTDIEDYIDIIAEIIVPIVRSIQIHGAMDDAKDDIEDVLRQMRTIIYDYDLSSITYATAIADYSAYFDYIDVIIPAGAAINLARDGEDLTTTISDLTYDDFIIESPDEDDSYYRVKTLYTSAAEPDLTDLSSMVAAEKDSVSLIIYTLLQMVATFNDIDFLVVNTELEAIEDIGVEEESAYELIRYVAIFINDNVLGDTETRALLDTLIDEILGDVLTNPDILDMTGLDSGTVIDIENKIQDILDDIEDIADLPVYAIATSADFDKIYQLRVDMSLLETILDPDLAIDLGEDIAYDAAQYLENNVSGTGITTPSAGHRAFSITSVDDLETIDNDFALTITGTLTVDYDVSGDSYTISSTSLVINGIALSVVEGELVRD